MSVEHNLAFRDEGTAKSDNVVKKYWTGTAWDPSVCNFNTLIYDPADDTTQTISGPNGPIAVVTHHPLDNQFRITIALPAADTALVNHKSTELAVDHATGEVLRCSFTRPQQQALRIQPVFSGAKYPFLTGSGGLVS